MPQLGVDGMQFFAAALGVVEFFAGLPLRFQRQEGLDRGLVLLGRLQAGQQRSAAARQLLIERVAVVLRFFDLPGERFQLRQAAG